MSSFKTQNSKLQPGTVLIGENGLPVDTIATIASSNVIIGNTTQPLVYAAGVVTVPVAIDLIPVRFHKSRYTGRLILRTADDMVFFIDRITVNDTTKQFTIYNNIKHLESPATIDLVAGWTIAEAEIVNRLATTSAAKIDQVEFRDMQFQIDLDGDPVTVIGSDGQPIEPNPDGSTESLVSNPVILNPVLAIVDTQYPIVVPKEAKRFSVKTRGNSMARLTLSYINNGSYITVTPGATYHEDKLSRSSDLTLYITSNKSNQTLELVYWT